MDRPALKRLLAAVEERSIDCIVVDKVDRLSRWRPNTSRETAKCAIWPDFRHRPARADSASFPLPANRHENAAVDLHLPPGILDVLPIRVSTR
jgi:hypothetical protein